MYLCLGLLLSIVAFIEAAAPDSNFNDVHGIIGGKNVTSDSAYSHHVSVQQRYNQKLFHRCDGVLINTTWVLTSASCELPIYSDLYVKAGSRAHNSISPMRKVVKVIVHPEFNLTSTENDNLVMLKLEKPLELSSYVTVARLSEVSSDYRLGLTGNISSWGSGDKYISKIDPSYLIPLKELQVTIINRTICVDHLSKWMRGPVPIDNSHFCAGDLSPGTAVCNKSTGSPLVVGNRILIGVFSWSPIPCASATGVGVYTDIYYYKDWIKRVMDDY